MGIRLLNMLEAVTHKSRVKEQNRRVAMIPGHLLLLRLRLKARRASNYLQKGRRSVVLI